MSGTLHAAADILRNDLRRRFRNRSFVLQAFVGPIVLAVLISVAFGGGFGFDVEVEVVSLDHSGLATQIQKGLLDASGEGVTFVRADSVADARRRIDHATREASAIVIPDGFAASLAGRSPKSLQVLTDRQNLLGATVGRSVATDVAARVNAGRLATFAQLANGRAAPDAAALRDLKIPIEIARRSSGDLSPAANVGPGIGLLFLFLSVAIVARSLLAEKRERVLDRIRAAPVSVTAILLGKCAGVVLTGCVSLLVLWGSTALLLGAAWGDPLGVLLLIFTSSLTVAGIAGVIAGIVRTEQSADLVATAVAFIFGIIGGSLVPLSQLPDTMVRLSFLTPNGWALHGFAELAAGQGSVIDVLPYAAMLVVWAAVAGTIAAVLLPRRLGAQ